MSKENQIISKFGFLDLRCSALLNVTNLVKKFTQDIEPKKYMQKLKLY